MSNSIDRAKEALNVSSDYELAKILGITHSAVAGYRRRENSLPLAQCLKVSELAGKTLDWLILGKGSDTDTASKKSVTSIPNIVLVPLYDVPVSAGHGSFFDTENIIQQIPFDTEWLEREELIAGQLACLPIKGDSMSPGLKTSDIVLIDLTHQRGDGVFVLRLNGALRIKRLQWLADGRLRISSDNPIYETEYVDPNTPPDDFAIIGFCHTKIGRVV
ncbi:LexA family transcriptional regulator [Eikenella corrodens]|uniref:LexA family transcriptional regulator n=1 Tax=Eikenella corrodens TaxID=539 RepID=UPI00142FFE72|nr:S24 family peptidase [Eikenella corrodens]